MELKSRDTQTAVKHDVLAKYLDKWAGIILNPKKLANVKQQADAGTQPDLHFVYVDCFSYIGRYKGDKHRSTETVFGSPIIGVTALDKMAALAKRQGVNIRINAILIEKSSREYAGLLETLALQELTPRIRETTNFSQLRSGDIAVVNGDSTVLMNDLVSYTQKGQTYSFYLLDPWGGDIPYDFVKTIVRQKRHDVMINFMYQDLNRKGGMARSDKISDQQRQQIETWTIAFGNESWKDVEQQARINPWDERWAIPLDSTDSYPQNSSFLMSEHEVAKRVERALAGHYKNTLKDMDRTLAVKLVNLQFAERERTMFYLFLTTHDPTGALSLNRILYEAKLMENQIRSIRRLSKEIEEAQQLALIPVEQQVGEPVAPPRPATGEIAQDVFRRFASRTVTRREIYRELVDTDYFPEEVNDAVKYLKKKGQVTFDGTLYHDKPLIRFSTI
jgi:three-Cys-motif partner protein